MVLMDLEIGGDRPLVPTVGLFVAAALEAHTEQIETIETRTEARARARALGAMRARWYAAMWRVGEVLLDDDGNELRLFIGGPSLSETQAQGRPLRFRVRQPRGNASS